MKDSSFFEKQKFTQPWVWVVLVASFLLPVFLPYFSGDEINLINENSQSIVLFGILFLIFFYSLELRTSVNSSGIHYQFFPLHLKTYTIKFNEIEKIEACIYSPIKDYGGWGIRFRYKAKAYNIKGNEGVKVYLKNGRHILFGSQCNKDFANEINRFMKL